MKKGICFAISAYLFWGIHPVYWKLLNHVPAIEIAANRIMWSFLFFAIVILFNKDWGNLKATIIKTRNKWILFFPALLIGSNWVLYIWAVNANYVVETSLGYFISPLISILLGVIILKEKLKPIQWLAVCFALTGVLVMTFVYNQFPWIGLYLAGTWGLYGMLRKKSPLSSSEGLTVETAILIIPAFSYLIYLSFNGDNAFIQDGVSTSLLLIGTGVISGLPLLIYIIASRIIPLSLIGMLQYIYPTLLFLLGVFVYGEELDEAKIIGFVFIWIGLLFYSLEGLWIKTRLGAIFESGSS